MRVAVRVAVGVAVRVRKEPFAFFLPIIVTNNTPITFSLPVNPPLPLTPRRLQSRYADESRTLDLLESQLTEAAGEDLLAALADEESDLCMPRVVGLRLPGPQGAVPALAMAVVPVDQITCLSEVRGVAWVGE